MLPNCPRYRSTLACPGGHGTRFFIPTGSLPCSAATRYLALRRTKTGPRAEFPGHIFIAEGYTDAYSQRLEFLWRHSLPSFPAVKANASRCILSRGLPPCWSSPCSPSQLPTWPVLANPGFRKPGARPIYWPARWKNARQNRCKGWMPACRPSQMPGGNRSSNRPVANRCCNCSRNRRPGSLR